MRSTAGVTRGSPSARRMRRIVDLPTRCPRFFSALNPRVAPRRTLRRHPHDQAPELEENVRRPGGARTSNAAQSVGCQHGSVSGVAIVAICQNADPTRYARAASRRRSFPVRHSPRPPAGAAAALFIHQVRDRPPSALEPAGHNAQLHLQRHRTDHGASLQSIRTSRNRPSRGTLRAWNRA
jgi:hypothetical protein